MLEKDVCDTLKAWSPVGLCRGQLVVQNGSQSTTVGCTVGCLALQVVMEEEEGDTVLKTAQHWIANATGELSRWMSRKIQDRFKMSFGELQDCMGYNDTCLSQQTGWRSWEARQASLDATFHRVPEEVRRTIYGLRMDWEHELALRDNR